MNQLLEPYKERLGLSSSAFTYIDHEDAMVATVFKVTQPDGRQLILKICFIAGDYFREVLFLESFAGKLPVAKMIGKVAPEADVRGAVLMECFLGELLKVEHLTEKLTYEIGSLLARIHEERVAGYGNPAEPNSLSSNPLEPFTLKFEEGFDECKDHLPLDLLQKCRKYFDEHKGLLFATDGPCVVHRDFRPGNLFVQYGKLQGIIDWSSARFSFAEEDFCPLEFGEWSENLELKNSFLEGYASIRKIPDYLKIMPLLRLNRAMGAIGFTVKRNAWQTKGAKIYQFNRRYLEKFFKD